MLWFFNKMRTLSKFVLVNKKMRFLIIFFSFEEQKEIDF